MLIFLTAEPTSIERMVYNNHTTSILFYLALCHTRLHFKNIDGKSFYMGIRHPDTACLLYLYIGMYVYTCLLKCECMCISMSVRVCVHQGLFSLETKILFGISQIVICASVTRNGYLALFILRS